MTLSPKPTGQATLCISVAARPSRFGITVHNAGYRALDLDFFYKAFQIEDISLAIQAVRTLGIRGCSVSMPFKETVIPHLDALDPLAEKAGAVNSVVNDEGHLTGFNTDIIGFKKALSTHPFSKEDRVLLLGAGGVARAIAVGLKELGLERIIQCARNPKSLNEFRDRFHVETATWEQRERIPAEILINATPVGMVPNNGDLPVSTDTLSNYRIVLDVVATPPVSHMVQTVRKSGKIAIDGLTMTLYQAAAQFELYTGHQPPMESMRDAALGQVIKVK